MSEIRIPETAIDLESVLKLFGDNYPRALYGPAAVILNAATNTAQELHLLAHALSNPDTEGMQHVASGVFIDIAIRLEEACKITQLAFTAERKRAELRDSGCHLRGVPDDRGTDGC